MAASAHPKNNATRSTTITTTKTRSNTTKTTIIKASSSPSATHVVAADAAWCCSTKFPHSPNCAAPPEQPPSTTLSQELAFLDGELASAGGCSFPAMETYPTPPYPSSYTKFNNALNAGLLNPMSPPPQIDKTRSSPTLFDMMANEQDYQPHPPPPPPPASRAQDRQVLLQDRVAEILGGDCSPLRHPVGNAADVKLTLTSRDGLSASATVHRSVLVENSRFFATRLSDRWSRQQRSLPHIVEISDCDDVEAYAETLRLMYCGDLRRRLMREDVSKVLAILKVSAAIQFDAGVVACLEYLEAAPWAEDEEEKVAAILSQLDLEKSGVGEVLKRVSHDFLPLSAEPSNSGSDGEEVLIRLLQVVLEGKDEKARREMKGLVSKMLRENSRCGNASDLSKESLYAACNDCLRLLRRHFIGAAGGDPAEAALISRQADNLSWVLDILVERQSAEEFLRIWAAQEELAVAHKKVPAVHRYEVSRVTARLLVGVGKGQILVSKEIRGKLLKTWLDAFYDDFGWMRRACKGLDRHQVEEGLGNTILTLPMAAQQEILLDWFDRFLNSGDDCPNIQRGFEVWWRRAFWRRSGEPELPPPQLRITASACENSC